MLLSHAVGELTCRAVRPMLVTNSRRCNLISVGGVSYADRASAGRDCLQRLLVYLYIKIGLSQCVSTGVAWVDGRSRAAGTGKAASCGSGRRGRGVRSARVQARLLRRASRQPKLSQNRAGSYVVLLHRLFRVSQIHCVLCCL